MPKQEPVLSDHEFDLYFNGGFLTVSEDKCCRPADSVVRSENTLFVLASRGHGQVTYFVI